MEANELLKYVGERMGMEELELNGDNACSLVLEDHVHVDFEYIEEKRELVVFSELGSVVANDPKERESIYVSLLSANLLDNHTAGAHMGLDVESGSVYLFHRVNCDKTNGDEFWEFFQNFVEAAIEWTELFESGSFEDANEEEDPAATGATEPGAAPAPDGSAGPGEPPVTAAAEAPASEMAPSTPSELAMSHFQKV